MRVQHILVMGHGRCGGISAMVADKDPLSKSDFIGKWMSGVRDLVETVPCPQGCSEHEHALLVERASIAQSLKNLHSFPWISTLEAKGELSVHGVWFDVALGELHVFDEATDSWMKLEN